MIGTCCKKPEVKTLHEPTGNKVCLCCGHHWYEGVAYTRREWDLKMDAIPFLKSSPFPMADHFGDLQIVEVKPKYIPVLQIRYETPMTDAFRAEMNAWLLELFGRRWQTENEMPLKVGQVIRFENTAMMRTETYQQVKAQLLKEGLA